MPQFHRALMHMPLNLTAETSISPQSYLSYIYPMHITMHKIYFSPAAALSFLGGGLVVLPRRDASFPSAASRSKKSCHSSASDSLLLELLAMSIGSEMELSEGVDGVRRKGELGRRRLELDVAPGRARPACSRCSGWTLIIKLMGR